MIISIEEHFTNSTDDHHMRSQDDTTGIRKRAHNTAQATSKQVRQQMGQTNSLRDL